MYMRVFRLAKKKRTHIHTLNIYVCINNPKYAYLGSLSMYVC